MSVDLAATLARPTTLGALLAGTRHTLAELLGPVPVPDLDLVADRRTSRGSGSIPGGASTRPSWPVPASETRSRPSPPPAPARRTTRSTSRPVATWCG
ncbi:hypothetical protein [Plantactinospora sp. BC1]|uniref:hypothetical protein n=1 Tax=Plantactinospora sp. BC1 TaxID=2108470 RepID=UPI00131F14F9|nr:hypothetical protein [Plantactinospora sp. BC1]